MRGTYQPIALLQKTYKRLTEIRDEKSANGEQVTYSQIVDQLMTVTEQAAERETEGIRELVDKI